MLPTLRASRLRSLAVCTLLSLVAAAAHAATLNVGPGQTYTTIQSAINAASTGDFISVAPGTYTENIDFKSKSITVICNASCSTATPGIIDGGGLGPVVTITGASANGATLNGFTVQNGGKPQTTNAPQGGVYVLGAAATISNNIITKTFCSGINTIAANPYIYGNNINKTLATGCAAQEGLGSGITLNTAQAVTAASPPAKIMRNTIELNTASVAYASDKGGGGAINIANLASIQISQNILRNNTTTGYAGALYIATTPTIVFDDNLVYGNKGISGGLDIVVPGSSVGNAVGFITNNTILDNLSTATNGGSEIYIGGNLAQYVLANNIIVGYSASDIAVNCGTTYASQTITPLVFDHNDIYSIPNSGNVPVGGACSSPAGKFGNISVDPRFVSATAAAITAGTGDFHLTTGSPALDSGNNSVLFVSADLDSNPRIADATGKGYLVVDMGVYELPGVQDIKPTTLFLSPSTFSPTVGGALTLTANVQLPNSATPSGSVTFYEDNASIGTSTVGTTGAATFAVTGLTAGTHSFYAVYGGPASTSPATSIPIYILVGPVQSNGITEVLVSSINPSAIGQSVTFTAHLSNANGTVPAGTVTFTDGPNTIGAVQVVDASGNASVTVTNLTPGSHTISAAYTPTGTFTVAATASLTQIVGGYQSQSVLTVNPTSAATGAPVTLTATVSALNATTSTVPTGTVVFYNGSTAISAAITLVNGVAAYTTSTLPGGTDNLTCVYSGDATFPTSNCNIVPVTISAAASTLTLTSSANPSPAATPITFTATLTSAGQPVPNATVVLTIAATPVITATGTTNASGVATFSTLGFPAGSYPVSVTFAATSSYNASSASLTELVNANATTLTVTAAANPSPALTPITFTALLTSNNQPVAGQSLVLTLNTAPVTILTLTTNAAGTVTYVNPGLAPGSYPVSVTFAATGSLIASSASFTETVVPNPTTTTLSASPSRSPQYQAVTLSASVHATTGAASPNGSLQFFDGTTLLGSVPVTAAAGATSTATFSTASFAVGTHSLTAIYVPGTPSFLASSSGLVPETILQQDFTFTSGSPSITIATGHKGTLPLTLTSVGAFAGSVSIACTGALPQYLTCEPPTAATLASGATSTGTLTLDTNRVLNFYGANHTDPLPNHNNLSRIALASLLPLTLLFGLARRRRFRNTPGTALSLCLLGLFAATLTGCTGFYPASTPPGTYTINLSATGTPTGAATPITHTTPITLIVTQ